MNTLYYGDNLTILRENPSIFSSVPKAYKKR